MIVEMVYVLFRGLTSIMGVLTMLIVITISIWSFRIGSLLEKIKESEGE